MQLGRKVAEELAINHSAGRRAVGYGHTLQAQLQQHRRARDEDVGVIRQELNILHPEWASRGSVSGFGTPSMISGACQLRYALPLLVRVMYTLHQCNKVLGQPLTSACMTKPDAPYPVRCKSRITGQRKPICLPVGRHHQLVFRSSSACWFRA